MRRRELESVLTKAAAARKSARRRALLKAAYASDALPAGFRSFGSFLYPLNPTVARETALQMPEAVRAQDRAQAGEVFRALGFRPAARTQAAETGPRRSRIDPTPRRALVPPKAAQPTSSRELLDQMGRDFLQAGKNMFTNPVDTLRRHFRGQPLKR